MVALPYEDGGWLYKQVPYGGDLDFYHPDTDLSGWREGQAGFGSTNDVCFWNNPTHVHTQWALGTDMLVRHQLEIPAKATNVRIAGTVDNDATIYVNGHELPLAQSGNCAQYAINVEVPEKYLDLKGDREERALLAIRGHDIDTSPGDADYLDVTVTYEISVK